VGSLELADWCVIDLDPKEAPFSDVVRTAQVLHTLCESIALPNYVKTTARPDCTSCCMGRQCTYANPAPWASCSRASCCVRRRSTRRSRAT